MDRAPMAPRWGADLPSAMSMPCKSAPPFMHAAREARRAPEA